jgi:hypothetical protein
MVRLRSTTAFLGGLCTLAATGAAAPPSGAAPGTTERAVKIEQVRFAFQTDTHLALRVDFDRAPHRLQQVVVGIHALEPARAFEAVTGRRFVGGMDVNLRPSGAKKWVAGRTYPLLVIFCARREASDADAQPAAHAA